MNSENMELLTSETEQKFKEMELLKLETEKHLNVFLTNLTEAIKKHNLPKPASLSVKIDLAQPQPLICVYNPQTGRFMCTW